MREIGVGGLGRWALSPSRDRTKGFFCPFLKDVPLVLDLVFLAAWPERKKPFLNEILWSPVFR